MTLFTLKWLAAFLLLVISLVTGLVSLRFVNRYQRLLQVGDAGANGIFIGAALFHLLPDATAAFHRVNATEPFIYSLVIAAFSFCILLVLDQTILKMSPHHHRLMGALLLTITLSIHAFVEGLVIGLSDSWKFTSVLFFAVLAHKAFEVFAFVINLHKRLRQELSIVIILIGFALLTPMGIWLGMISHDILTLKTDNWLSAFFNAFAVGTFLYIGSMHRHHSEYHLPKDSYHQYNEVLAMLMGIFLMGLLGLFF